MENTKKAWYLKEVVTKEQYISGMFRMQFRVTPEQASAISEILQQRGIDITEYLTEIIEKEIKHIKAPETKININT